MQNSIPIVVYAWSRLRTEQKHKTEDFTELHNQIILFTVKGFTMANGWPVQKLRPSLRVQHYKIVVDFALKWKK